MNTLIRYVLEIIIVISSLSMAQNFSAINNSLLQLVLSVSIIIYFIYRFVKKISDLLYLDDFTTNYTKNEYHKNNSNNFYWLFRNDENYYEMIKDDIKINNNKIEIIKSFIKNNGQ